MCMNKLKCIGLQALLGVFLLGGSIEAGAQQSKQLKTGDTLSMAPEDWIHLDAQLNGVAGVSTGKAYAELLKGKEAKREVVVAVIDSGVDVEHEDLQGKVWINAGEIAGNGIDDDGNGYIDDIHGWNFIGGKDGQNVNHDTYEITRLYASLSARYKGKTVEEVADKKEFALYEEIKEEFEAEITKMREQAAGFLGFYERYELAKEQLREAMGVEELVEEDVDAYKPETDEIKEAKAFLQYAVFNGYTDDQIQEVNDYFSSFFKYNYNPEYNSREIVGDNYADLSERFYGNNDVEGPDAQHGTHVAGIIAAVRGNELGMEGVADPVKIMAIRAVPNGDERDKDVANAIYYAVDNGAHVINMSFGKAYSPQKAAVDAAVRYAEEKGVLLVHAAGNEGKNIDKENNFPTKHFLDSRKTASNWLEVGASSWGGATNFVADFSNYGRKTVDVFAPGVDIFSTTPDDAYESLSGTSMAAPVTTGVAALIMAYYPELPAKKVKKIIMKSATNYRRHKVNMPGQEDSAAMVRFKKLSDSGGVVNAYEALRRAEKKSR